MQMWTVEKWVNLKDNAPMVACDRDVSAIDLFLEALEDFGEIRWKSGRAPTTLVDVAEKMNAIHIDKPEYTDGMNLMAYYTSDRFKEDAHARDIKIISIYDFTEVSGSAVNSDELMDFLLEE